MSEKTATPRPPTPPERLWRRCLRARGARAGFALVAFFGLTAFLAPFLAQRLPFYWRDYASGAFSFPLIREFFAPSDTTEPFLEKGINFLFLFIPAALLAWKLMNARLPGLARTESRAVSWLFGALIAAALWAALGGMVIDGGGRDWLYREIPPVPEIDDISDPKLVLTEGSLSSRRELAALVLDSLRRNGFAPDAPVNANPDDLRRNLNQALQKAIEGSAIAPVERFAGTNGIDAPGITAASLDRGINRARWNRLLVEAAFPGLLTPMRQFRGAFLLLAAVTLLTLLGLTYICMAGANQFSVSPRWLVLMLLGLALAIPFRHVPRHDHTPYRQLAAEGKGWGIFPPIPYGPNEQGFGPRLPPTWWPESPTLSPESIRSWDRLRQDLAADSPEAAFLRERLGKAESESAILAGLNNLIAGDRLDAVAEAAGIRGGQNLTPYLDSLRAGRTPTPEQQQRLNRMLLERYLPDALVPAAASQWKTPRHIEGYHLLGTDESGRDVLVRIIHGARVSLSVGFVSVFLATVIGLVMGSLAAYYGGWVDMAISRFLEIMMCFPSFFLILAVIAVLDRRSIINIMLVIGLTSWTEVARLVRGEMLRQKKLDYVSASIALGAEDTRTIFRHILPNSMAPVLVSISFGITAAILTEAGLSFIGFGVTPPTPTWGQLLSETRDSPLANWWLAVFPGMVLFLSVAAYNLAGEAIREALDPRAAA